MALLNITIILIYHMLFSLIQTSPTIVQIRPQPRKIPMATSMVCSTRENLARHCFAMESEVFSCWTGNVAKWDIVVHPTNTISRTQPCPLLFIQFQMPIFFQLLQLNLRKTLVSILRFYSWWVFVNRQLLASVKPSTSLFGYINYTGWTQYFSSKLSLETFCYFWAVLTSCYPHASWCKTKRSLLYSKAEIFD